VLTNAAVGASVAAPEETTPGVAVLAPIKTEGVMTDAADGAALGVAVTAPRTAVGVRTELVAPVADGVKRLTK